MQFHLNHVLWHFLLISVTWHRLHSFSACQLTFHLSCNMSTDILCLLTLRDTLIRFLLSLAQFRFFLINTKWISLGIKQWKTNPQRFHLVRNPSHNTIPLKRNHTAIWDIIRCESLEAELGRSEKLRKSKRFLFRVYLAYLQ